ncbi:hypothetical protein GEZ85_07820 [Streptococcus mitis]|uniref:Uncharacterized protein n=1 Tax=Streptococcus mitis TaxID=28037 RepID=A0A6I1UHA1_STRMT|nr:hypothetical protein [Streptococcus mitis]MQQ39977.1 hypothetical protein [Streptococcus mitis]MQQ62409.1 hypothetical protein [Streptococcus mitis]
MSLFIIDLMGLFFYNKIGSIISIGDLPTTNIIEPNKIGSIISIGDLPTTNIIEPFFSTTK